LIRTGENEKQDVGGISKEHKKTKRVKAAAGGCARRHGHQNSGRNHNKGEHKGEELGLKTDNNGREPEMNKPKCGKKKE